MSSVESVSAIIPTYNDTSYLEQAIDSVLSQSIDGIDVEVIVVDSSPGDEVERIVDAYGSNVVYEWTEPTGVAAARNHGIEHSSGDVIGFCDADDYWAERKLEYQIPKINAGYDIVYSDEYLIDDGTVMRLRSPTVEDPENHHIKYFRTGGIGSRSILARRGCFEDETFDEEYDVREDPHLWTRLFANYTVARVDKPLSYKRRSTTGITADRDRAYRMQLREIEDLVERFPELRPYRSEREASAKVLYAKTLLSYENRASDARTVLLEVLRERYVTPRVVGLFFISLLPTGNMTVLKGLQRTKWAVANTVSKS